MSYITGLEATFVMEFEKNVSKQQMGKYLLSLKLPKYSHLECPHFPSTFRQNVCTLRSEAWKQSTAICKKKDRKYLKVTHWRVYFKICKYSTKICSLFPFNTILTYVEHSSV